MSTIDLPEESCHAGRPKPSSPVVFLFWINPFGPSEPGLLNLKISFLFDLFF